jgi:hypothetical protein
MEIKVDMGDVLRLADQLGVAAREIPYSMSRSLNSALFDIRSEFIDRVWPDHVTVRNPSFLRHVLRVETSSKYNLKGAIKEVERTSNPLLDHALGGVRTPAKAREFAIPTSAYAAGKQTSRGLRAAARIRELIARTPRRSLRITSRGVYIGRGGKLELAFAFKPRIEMKADVPFFETFETEVRRRFFDKLPEWLIRSLRTRRD